MATPALSFTLDELVRNLIKLNSFRMTFGLEGRAGVQMVMNVRPRRALAVRAADGSGRPNSIRIENRAWIDAGAQGYQEVPAALIPALGGYIFESVPADLLTINKVNLDPKLDLGALVTDTLGLERKNGFEAQHYRIRGTPLVCAFLPLNDSTTIDLWVSKDGYIVAYALMFQNRPFLTLDVSHPNEPTDRIAEPR